MKNLCGVIFAKHESRSKIFADDTSIFMARKEEYLHNTMRYFEAFSKISGLK